MCVCGMGEEHAEREQNIILSQLLGLQQSPQERKTML